MNTATQLAIEFLTHAELPFGAEEDVLLLSDPEALRERVATLLSQNPTILGEEKSAQLQAQLGEVDWPVVAGEFQARVALAADFFDDDAVSHTTS